MADSRHIRLRKFLFSLLLVLLLFPLPLGAQEITSPGIFFTAGNNALEGMVGPMYSPVYNSEEREVLNFVQANIRIGHQLNDPDWTDGWYRGVLEFMGEATLSRVHQGFADYIVGAGPMLRYSFVQPDWTVAPYVQVGIDFVYSDGYKDRDQEAIGSAVSFLDHAALGIRWFANDRWSLNLEGRFQHISNAGLDNRNVGVNSFGALLGVSCLFDTSI